MGNTVMNPKKKKNALKASASHFPATPHSTVTVCFCIQRTHMCTHADCLPTQDTTLQTPRTRKATSHLGPLGMKIRSGKSVRLAKHYYYKTSKYQSQQLSLFKFHRFQPPKTKTTPPCHHPLPSPLPPQIKQTC